MRVLIYEPKYVGHFLGFATWAANAFARLGYEVVFAVPQCAVETQQAKVKLAHVLPAVDLQYVIEVPRQFDKWKNARFESTALSYEIGRFRPDYLVAPSADFLLSGLLANRTMRNRVRRLAGADFVLHAVPQAYPALGPREVFANLVERLCVQLADTIQLHTVDPYATRPGRGSLGIWGDSVRQLPHPFESLTSRDRTAARERLGLPVTARILGSLGDLGVRKGTDALLKGFYALDRTDLHLLLCGVLSDEVRDLVGARPDLVDNGRLHIRDEFVSDDRFNDAIYAVDGLWAGYPRQIGIASMLLFAAEARRPVIASNNGSIGWMTREYGLGQTFDPSEATKALSWFCDATDFAVDETGAARLMKYHTLDNFEHELTRNLVELHPPAMTVASR